MKPQGYQANDKNMYVTIQQNLSAVCTYSNLVKESVDPNMQNKKVTFDDIARYTNFSKTTISRYFNRPDSLTLENQKIIAQALVDLDYRENKLAKVLANGKSEFIGIILPNFSYHFYSEMLKQILSTYKKYGYKFLVFSSNNQEETERCYIQELLAYKIEGLIILSHTITSKELASYHIPLVTIEREDQYVSSVNTDNYSGAVQAANLLLQKECDILFHINVNVSPQEPSYGRIQGFIDTCQKSRHAYELILQHLGNTYSEIHTTLNHVLHDIEEKYPAKRKGFFMATDTHANILLNLLVRRYGKLPADYCIIGFDNSPIANEAVIPITTVGQQIAFMANTAMDLLVQQMDERKKRQPIPWSAPVHKSIPPQLILRETT